MRVRVLAIVLPVLIGTLSVGASSCGRRRGRGAPAPERGPGVDASGASLAGEINQCPQLVSHSVAPLDTEVGRTIELRASATDPDCPHPDGAICGPAVAWTASAGSISPLDSPAATYTCTEPGTHVLTVTAGDGKCKVSQDILITCRRVPCTDAGNRDCDARD
jgi:hypothetical protein